MNKTHKKILFVNALILPIIPLLYLYNQNSQYLYPPQIIILGAILVVATALFFGLCNAIFHSEFYAFVASLVFVILLFAYNNIAITVEKFYDVGTVNLLLIPLVTYIITFLLYKIFKHRDFENFPPLVTVALSVMLAINLSNLVINASTYDASQNELEYKTSFNIDSGLRTPNVYWFFCDGMLGFDAMATYFQNPQLELNNALTERGFLINRGAMLETLHWTGMAIPTLMCPDYYDRYLNDVLTKHKTNMDLKDITKRKLNNSRVNNETINAFDAKGYDTVTISINDIYFFPTTDYFYYVNASYKPPQDYINTPYYVKKAYNSSERSKLYICQLDEVFLYGMPSMIYDVFHKHGKTIKYDLSTSFDNTSDILLGNGSREVNSALVKSLYDSLHSEEVNGPKFILIHDLMAHMPFVFDENGDTVADPGNIYNYPGHHTYSTKVLMNLVDMVLVADPNAVIILQADHGLHAQTEQQIMSAFGDPNASTDIWNNVFCAIRVPEQYQNGDEDYALADPRNIARYLINSCVGNNCKYITEGSKKEN